MIITRGLAEMVKVSLARGGEAITLAGLAGMGDLVATCSSDQSRNHRVGVELGRGRPLADIHAATPMIAEGVGSSPVVCMLAAEHGVEMPLSEQVRDVCAGDATVAEAVAALLRRPATSE
jgi:glycerol-3-phosphate dehydrogenase (NAD(P)+)